MALQVEITREVSQRLQLDLTDGEQAVREAGAEYDRLVENAEVMQSLRQELQHLRERITTLEREVERLRKPN